MIPVSQVFMGFITIGIVYMTVADKGRSGCDGPASNRLTISYRAPQAVHWLGPGSDQTFPVFLPLDLF